MRKEMKTGIGMLTGIMLLVSCGQGQAVTLGGLGWTDGGTTLSLTATQPGGNQPQNIQCIICGDNQPQQQADFGYTNFHNTGSMTDILYFSTAVAGGGDPGSDTLGIGYDGSFLRNYLIATGDVNLTFSVGIDVNDAGKTPQVLESFYLLNLTQHTVLASFQGPADIGSANNGTGFPDFTLDGFNISLGSDIMLGDQLIFFARISNASDGPDSFFLIPSPAAAETPLPAAVWMFGGVLGLAGMVAGQRKRRRRSVWDEEKTA
jgi:hypothetical protein